MSTGDPKSPERSAVAYREAIRERGEAGTDRDHPSLGLPVEGREPERPGAEPQQARSLFRADLTAILQDANHIEISLPTAYSLQPTVSSPPFDARLAIVGRS